MSTTPFVPRAPKEPDDVHAGDDIWVVNSFGPENRRRRRAHVFDVLRRACVLEGIEGRNSGEKMTVPFNGLELMDPADQPPSAPSHRAWVKRVEKEKEIQRQNEQRNEQRQLERRNPPPPPPPPVMPTVARRTSSEPLRAVPPALQNIADAVKPVPPPQPSGPPSMLTWAEQGLQMNIQQAHALEDRIGDIDQEIEKLKASIADQIATLEVKKKAEQEKLAQTRLMIETIEAQIATLKAS